MSIIPSRTSTPLIYNIISHSHYKIIIYTRLVGRFCLVRFPNVFKLLHFFKTKNISLYFISQDTHILARDLSEQWCTYSVSTVSSKASYTYKYGRYALFLNPLAGVGKEGFQGTVSVISRSPSSSLPESLIYLKKKIEKYILSNLHEIWRHYSVKNDHLRVWDL